VNAATISASDDESTALQAVFDTDAVPLRIWPWQVLGVAALPAPSDREKTELYMQRHVRHFPAAVGRT
jgi:hypothetical protein